MATAVDNGILGTVRLRYYKSRHYPNPLHLFRIVGTADLLNFGLVHFLTAIAFNRSREDAAQLPVITMLSGFNYFSDAVALDRPLFAVWKALANEVRTIDNLFDQLAAKPGGRIALAAFSPSPWTSMWWNPINCRAQFQSPVLAQFRNMITDILDDRAAEAWIPERFLTSVVISQRLGNATLPNLQGLILILARGGGRQMWNQDDAFSLLCRHYPKRPVAMVKFDSSVPWLIQYAAWRIAQVTVGIHGGNLGAAVFLSPGQALIEGTFGGMCSDPTMFANIAVSNGAFYRCASVLRCRGKCMEGGGDVDLSHLQQALHELRGLLENSSSPSSQSIAT